MRHISIICIAAALFCVAACGSKYPEPVNPNATPEARELLRSLYESVDQGKIISGIHHNEYTINNEGYYNDLNRIADVCGREPKIWGGDLGWYGDAMIEKAIKNYESGHIITLMWHVARPFDKGYTIFKDQVQGEFTDEQWNDLVTPGTEMYNMWLAQVDSISINFLKPLKDRNIPVLWRPYHENNGEWFWWGWREGENGFKKLWINMYDRMVNYHHLDNILWVWNANAPRDIPNDTALAYDRFYPGNDYVDVLATDVYNRDWKQSHHDQLLELGGGKLIALGEIGNVPTPADLETQNKFAWFMIWCGFTGERMNTTEELSALFNLPQVVTIERTGD